MRIMIADPSLEVCVPRHLSRLWGRSTAVTAVSSRQSRDAPAEALLGLRQGQFYVVGDSDILLSRFSRGREGVFGPSIYEYRFENGKVREKIAFFQKYFCRLHGSCVFCYTTTIGIKDNDYKQVDFRLTKDVLADLKDRIWCFQKENGLF